MNRSICFTRAREEDRRWIEDDRAREERSNTLTLSGEEAKSFYQSLVGEGDGGTGRGVEEDNRRERRKRTRESRGGRAGGRDGRGGPPLGLRPPQTNTHSEQDGHTHSQRDAHVHTRLQRDGHKLLRCSQEGDLGALRRLLAGGCDVNFRDEFYWTAVMCASFAGRPDAVRTLLRAGAAWVGVVDTQGRDARDLAEQAGHQEVLRELVEYGGAPDQSAAAADAEEFGSASQSQWCPVCESHHSEADGRHASSTLHQFSLGRRPFAPHYCLPPSSAGYRMMIRSGWDPGAGLGPVGDGRKQPIRTVLKRDQAGLGFGPAPPAKVTHFQPKDPQAVKQPQRERAARGSTLSAQALRRKEERDRNWERDFRTSFNIDL